MRHDDQHLHAAAEQRFDVLNLSRRVAIARLHEDFGTQFFGPAHESIAIALPAFFLQRPQREANSQGAVGRALRFSPRSAAEHNSNQDAQSQREQDQPGANGHRNGFRRERRDAR